MLEWQNSGSIEVLNLFFFYLFELASKKCMHTHVQTETQMLPEVKPCRWQGVIQRADSLLQFNRQRGSHLITDSSKVALCEGARSFTLPSNGQKPSQSENLCIQDHLATKFLIKSLRINSFKQWKVLSLGIYFRDIEPVEMSPYRWIEFECSFKKSFDSCVKAGNLRTTKEKSGVLWHFYEWKDASLSNWKYQCHFNGYK